MHIKAQKLEAQKIRLLSMYIFIIFNSVNGFLILNEKLEPQWKQLNDIERQIPTHLEYCSIRVSRPQLILPTLYFYYCQIWHM